MSHATKNFNTPSNLDDLVIAKCLSPKKLHHNRLKYDRIIVYK